MNSGPRDHTNDDLIRKLTETVIDNLTNEQFAVSALSAEMGMSRSNLHRKVTMITIKSMSQFIREIRLTEAHKFLKENELTVRKLSSLPKYKIDRKSINHFGRFSPLLPGGPGR